MKLSVFALFPALVIGGLWYLWDTGDARAKRLWSKELRRIGWRVAVVLVGMTVALVVLSQFSTKLF